MTVQPITSALFLPTLNVADDDAALIDRMLNNLRAYETGNALKAAYYEGEQRVHSLGISIPPSMSRLEAVVGWPGTTVDVLEERLDWYGWASEDDTYGLQDVYTGNGLDVDAGMAHLDALIYGTSFAVVGSGEDDEPSPLVTIHSPRGMTGWWDARRRRLHAAVSTIVENGFVTEVTLYKPDETLVLVRSQLTSRWEVAARDRHQLGRVPVVQFVNRGRASRLEGRSEISQAIRYYTDDAVRTMVGMEVNREFYSAPQRYALGVDESAFTDAGGNVRTGWETIMGRVWALDRDDDGNLPEVGQFTPASPAPYLEQVKGLALLVAAEAAIPPSYLGFATDNPASGDAIQKSEARLVKRAERRQQGFGRGWHEVGRLALLVRDGQVPDDYDRSVTQEWRDASTPTNAADADAAVKLVSAGILPAGSPVTYNRVGLSPADQRQLEADRQDLAPDPVAALADTLNRQAAALPTTATAAVQ